MDRQGCDPAFDLGRHLPVLRRADAAEAPQELRLGHEFGQVVGDGHDVGFAKAAGKALLELAGSIGVRDRQFAEARARAVRRQVVEGEPLPPRESSISLYSPTASASEVRRATRWWRTRGRQCESSRALRRRLRQAGRGHVFASGTSEYRSCPVAWTVNTRRAARFSAAGSPFADRSAASWNIGRRNVHERNAVPSPGVRRVASRVALMLTESFLFLGRDGGYCRREAALPAIDRRS